MKWKISGERVVALIVLFVIAMIVVLILMGHKVDNFGVGVGSGLSP